jgi:hypothetical protein
MSPPWYSRALERVDRRNAHLWAPDLAASALRREAPVEGHPVHVYVCVADHFEPRWRKPSLDEERRRVRLWADGYPALAARHRDSFGRAHQRTLFFPVEEYRPEHLHAINELVGKGLVDVEVHLHHENDTADNLRRTLADFAALLHEEHGLLRKDPATGKVTWAFIHGNWALDNAMPDGRYCGVDDELSVLLDAGCYVDMTMPCVPSPAQGRVVNQIYYARSSPGRSRGHDTGREALVGTAARDGELMLIPGPLALHWKSRAMGLVPRVEAAMLEPENPVPFEQRVDSWLEHGVALRGAPNHRFVKLHAHGCNGDAPEWFLREGGPFDRLLTTLERATDDTRRWVLHYVTARELYETVKSLEDGTLSNT